MDEDNNEQVQGGESFESFILGRWAELFEISTRFRTNYMLDKKDLELSNTFFGKLTRIWGALRPKVEGRADMKDVQDKFMAFEKYYYDPLQLSREENYEDIFKMEAIIEQVLDKLLVTSFRE